MIKYFLIGFFLFINLPSEALRVAPTILEGYTYMPSGPITFLELKEYDGKIVKDLKHNGIVGLDSKWLYIYVKKKGEEDFKFYRYADSQNENETLNIMDTLSQYIHIDDSIAISVRHEPNKDFQGKKRGRSIFQTQTKYAIKTETIAALLRKGEDLIIVYPNPCRTETSIKLDVSEKLTASYYILDGFGRKIQKGKLQDIRLEIPIDLKDQSRGTFVFYIIVDTEIFNKKIVKL